MGPVKMSPKNHRERLKATQPAAVELAKIEGKLALLATDGGHGPIFCDFVGGSVAHRRQFGGGYNQPLARACGISSKFKPRICDACAGMGGDSLVLASLGANVTLIERQPAVWAILEDGLARLIEAAKEDPRLAKLADRLALIHRDSVLYLGEFSQGTFDVVYLDPMFPPRTKSAKVKKEMVAFHQLVGADLDADSLLEAAQQAAQYRVVVKRPRGAQWLAGAKPSHVIEGKTVRYDIYVSKAIPK